MMQIYNSLTKRKEQFEPLNPNEIRMYVCGMTVYDYCHIGHARSWIIFDMIVRYLRSRGKRVHFVKNITDIDDKIIKRAHEKGEAYDAITQRFIDALHEDEKALAILPPDDEPRATEYIPQIIDMIEKLIEKKYAYAVDNGDVYFQVRNFKDYGKLSHRDLKDLIAGARVEIDENKNDPLDFVLWKAAKPGEPHWPSPWGEGRPGWHIECSAMSLNLLGQPFDIHGGGMDLKFPHHENEIAQSEAAGNKPFVNYWMHAGLLLVNQEKMSKSLGNFFTIRDVLKKYSPEMIRYFMLSSHYRSPVNYSEENMTSAHQALTRLYLSIRGLPNHPFNSSVDHSKNKESSFAQAFHAAMEDDFNTPQALAILFDMAREVNRLRDHNKLEDASELATEMKNLSQVFDLLQNDPDVFLKGNLSENEDTEINHLIHQRNEARLQKNWKEADRVRQELLTRGITIEDTDKGTIWRKV